MIGRSNMNDSVTKVDSFLFAEFLPRMLMKSPTPRSDTFVYAYLGLTFAKESNHFLAN
jgi:hypothetical protein